MVIVTNKTKKGVGLMYHVPAPLNQVHYNTGVVFSRTPTCFLRLNGRFAFLAFGINLYSYSYLPVLQLSGLYKTSGRVG